MPSLDVSTNPLAPAALCIFDSKGVPATKGSTKGFVNKKTGRVMITNSCVREAPWAAIVHWDASAAWTLRRPFEGPVQVDLYFRLPRPKRLKKAQVNFPHDKKPDVDKLARSVLDALTGVLWFDDAQVARLIAVKVYADEGVSPGVNVRVGPYAPTSAG